MTSAVLTSKLYFNYLEEVAYKKAQLDAGVQKVAFSCLERLIHFLFNYIFYIFYPAYEQFYDEKRVEVFLAEGLELPKYESSRFREAVLFIHRFIASPSTIGSIFPSSNHLTQSITRQIPVDDKPHRYLEIGAGTGSFTEEIIKKLKPTDRLDVVEYDPQLCKLLKRKYRHLKNVAIHQISILDFSSDKKYDRVISGLPLNIFTPDFVDRVLEKYEELTAPEGYLSYFEYMAIPTIKQAFLFGQASRDFARILNAKAQFVQSHPAEADQVYFNITPARVLHCKMGA